MSHSLNLRSGVGVGRLVRRRCAGYNAVPKVISKKNTIHVCMFALRDIAAGEEIVVMEEDFEVNNYISIIPLDSSYRIPWTCIMIGSGMFLFADWCRRRFLSSKSISRIAKIRSGRFGSNFLLQLLKHAEKSRLRSTNAWPEP